MLESLTKVINCVKGKNRANIETFNSEIFNFDFDVFKNHYMERFGAVKTDFLDNIDGVEKRFIVKSPKLREGNYPNILYHTKPSKNVIVLVHGLMDSPFYMEAIAKRFYHEGATVVLPLLHGHGLKDPDEEMKDNNLNKKWKKDVENAVDMARILGDCVSIGGLSAGGTLSINFILQHPDEINGGVFLFSAALNVGKVKGNVGKVPLFKSIIKLTDGKIEGIGQNPYKYPVFSDFGGLELTDIIRENIPLLESMKINPPVFAVHSRHDKVAKIEGITELFKNHVLNGVLLLISENPPIEHASVVLAENIKLDEVPGKKQDNEPQANPKFEYMMDTAIRFFKEFKYKS